MKAVEASSLVTGWSSGNTNCDKELLMVVRGETVSLVSLVRGETVSLGRRCLVGGQCLYVLAICLTALTVPSNMAVGT